MAIAASTCPALQFLHSSNGCSRNSNKLNNGNSSYYISCQRLLPRYAFVSKCRAPATRIPAVASKEYVVSEEGLEIEEDEEDRVLYVDSDSEKDSSEEKDESNLAIANLGVAKEIVDALAARGITELFPIQRAVLEPALKGSDIIARAKTGTGKTLAFGIPIMDQIFRERDKSVSRRLPKALILAPTRELAKQVEKEFIESASSLSTVCVYGGVSILSQKRQLSRGVDVAVGTPGRIIDLLEQGALKLNEVECLVLDEADQMLAVGFEEDVERILDQLPEKRQNMLFSATMPSWVKRLSRKYLNKPLTIDLVGESDEKLAEGIKIFAIQSTLAGKRSILSDVITVYGKGGKTIVFTRTKKDAEEVSLSMNRSLGCESLHGDIAQFQREKTLAAFREGKFLILVATDVAARGLDITNVDLIIHYDLPNDSETFVHRSGRTGRAGKQGTALVMYATSQKRAVRQIAVDVGCHIEYRNAPKFSEVLSSSSSHAVEMIKGVHPELKDVFLSTAEKLLEEQGTSAFAAALAHMCGYSQPPPCRSLLSFEPGWMTLQFTRARGAVAVRNVVGLLASIYEKAADNIGKVQLIDEIGKQGAVFDLPEDIARELLKKEGLQQGDKIEMIKELPNLEEEEYGSSNSRSRERFSSRGGGYSSRSRTSSFDSNRASPYGRSSSSSSYSSYGNKRSFPGTCYKCGEEGHRASDCPKSGNWDGGRW